MDLPSEEGSNCFEESIEERENIIEEVKDLPVDKKEMVEQKPLLPKNKKNKRIEKGSLEKEDQPLFVQKLKKTETVKRARHNPELEKVELKSHAFEQFPENEEEEGKSSVILRSALNIKFNSSELESDEAGMENATKIVS